MEQHAVFATHVPHDERGASPGQVMIEYLVLRHRKLDPVPRRGHFACLAIFYAIALAYGSWLPFEFSQPTIADASSRFQAILARPIQWSTDADFTINALLLVPLSFAMLAAVGSDRSRWRDWVVAPIALAVCGAVSLLIEFGQSWLPMRVESQNDVAAQFIGIICGVAAWIVGGRTFVRFLRSLPTAPPGLPRLRLVLQLYCVGFLVYAALPLDFVTDWKALSNRLAAGRVNLVPFAGLGLDFAGALTIVKKMLYFTPFGLLAAFPDRENAFRARVLVVKSCFGWLFAVLMSEVLQALTRSRTADVTDVLLACGGIVIGALLADRIPWSLLIRKVDSDRPLGLRIAAASAVCGFVVMLMILFWSPFERVDDPIELRHRFNSFFALPFLRLWAGTEINALGQIVLKTGTFAILGALTSLTFSHRPIDSDWPIWRVRSAVVFAALVAAVLEIGQIFYADRYPDAFDIVLGALGGFLGLVSVEYLTAPPLGSDLVDDLDYFSPHPTRRTAK